MFRTVLIPALALAAAALALTGGAVGQNAKPDIRGKVTKVTPANDEAKKRGVLGSLLVEAPKGAQVTYDKAHVRVTTKTRIQTRVGKALRPATFADLKEGVQVEAVFTGPVAESYPVQATAGEIVILTAAK